MILFPLFKFCAFLPALLLTSFSMEQILIAIVLIAVVSYLLIVVLKNNDRDFIIDNSLHDNREISLIPSGIMKLDSLSQDLKIPLTLMLGPLSRISKSSKIPVSDKKLLSKVHSVCNEMLNKINLANSKSTDKKEVNNTTTNLFQFVRDTIYTFESFANSRGIRLNFQYTASRDLYLSIDEYHLKTIIANLIYNAIKYSNAPGGVLISIVDQQNSIEFNFIDKGIGIDESELDVIFEKNKRGNNAILSEVKGTGLGLYIVKEYVERIGGQISVKSKKNEGSTFTLKIPRIEVITSSDSIVELNNVEVANSGAHEEASVLLGKERALLSDSGNGSDVAIDRGIVLKRSETKEPLESLKKEIDFKENSMHIFFSSKGLSSTDLEWLNNLEEDVNKNISEFQYGVEVLAENMGISRSQLFRRLKALTELSPIHYIREKKLLRAKSHLENSTYSSVREVALSVGISKISYFAKLYYTRFGAKPSSYFH